MTLKATGGDAFYNLLIDAMAMEEAGGEFYKRASEIVNISLAKVTLSSLIEDELKHKIAILRFCKRKDVKVEKPKRKDLFGMSIEELRRKFTAFTPLEKIYEFALNFEKQSYDYYAKLKPKTSDKEAHRLLDFLEGEENRHYKLLSGTFQYLSRPTDWFTEDEKPVVEG